MIIVIASFGGLHGMTDESETKAPKPAPKKEDLLTGIIYRQAQPSDLDKMLAIYKIFNEDDAHKLLVLPEHIRVKAVTKNIELGRFFIATDRNGEIISFVKVFVIYDHDELQDVLQNELRFKPDGIKSPEQRLYDVKIEAVSDFSKEIKAAVVVESKLPEYVFGSPECVYVYYGSAYTRREYRGLGIATELLSCALTGLEKQTLEDMQQDLGLKRLFIDSEVPVEVQASGIALVYGQVNANVGNMGQLRPFVHFAQRMRAGLNTPAKTRIRVHHMSCQAYKPEFDARGNFVPDDLEKNKGRGNMLYISLS